MVDALTPDQILDLLRGWPIEFSHVEPLSGARDGLYRAVASTGEEYVFKKIGGLERREKTDILFRRSGIRAFRGRDPVVRSHETRLPCPMPLSTFAYLARTIGTPSAKYMNDPQSWSLPDLVWMQEHFGQWLTKKTERRFFA